MPKVNTSEKKTTPVSRNAGNTFFFQPKLSVNQPGDLYEQEADAVADKAMRMADSDIAQTHFFKPPVSPIQRKCAHCEEDQSTLQRKETNGDEMPVTDSLEKYVGNLGNGGQPLPGEVRDFYEPRLGHDFANVKVHTDTVAAKSAQSINALAYTSGNNIVFNSGQYSPYTGSGKRLLGHELVHVVQQGGANTIQTKKDVNPAPLSIQRKINNTRSMLQRVASHFGDFNTTNYNDVNSTAAGTPAVGAQIYLKFTPNNLVDARKIGLVQIARGVIGGTVDAAGYRGRRMATHGAGQGFAVDRVSGFPNPVYPTRATQRPGESQQDLGAYDTEPVTPLTPAQITQVSTNMGLTGINYSGWGKLGYRFMQAGVLQGPVDAELYDAPSLGNSGNNSEQVFETAALAIEGVQTGTYYGSVRWGWRRNGTGQFSRIPLTIVSQGAPSNNFMTAAAIWNTATEDIGRETSAALANVQVVSITGTTVTAVPGTFINIPAHTRLQILASAVLGGANVFVARVTIAGVNSTSIIPEGSTTVIDIGRPTVDLPVFDVFTINRSGGVNINQGISGMPHTNLPNGTRVRHTTIVMGPFVTGDPRATMVGVEVVDSSNSALVGTIGWVNPSVLQQEARGTR